MTTTLNLGNHTLVSINDREPPLFKLDDIMAMIMAEQGYIRGWDWEKWEAYTITDEAGIRQEIIEVLKEKEKAFIPDLELVTPSGFNRLALGLVAGGCFDDYRDYLYEEVMPALMRPAWEQALEGASDKGELAERFLENLLGMAAPGSYSREQNH